MKKKIRAIILRTAGTNCDKETAYAFSKAGAEVDLVHINTLKLSKDSLSKYHILAIPGGFTYGDDVASGKILANELNSTLKKELTKFISNGKLIIGICNGFQVLVKMGVLPRIKDSKDYNIDATLSLNDSGKFIDKWIYLKSGDSGKGSGVTKCVWTRGIPEIIYVPIAHGEGKFIPKNNKILNALKNNGQIVFRYTNGNGDQSGYPHNPNGSVDDIAGICDPTGRILGMMPHPERHLTYLQHPHWQRLDKSGKDLGIGLKIFKNGVNFARKHL